MYVGAFAWLISPLWSATSAATAERAAVRNVPVDPSIGIVPLAASRALPTSLPGSSKVVVATSPEVNGAEVVSEGETEATASAPEGEEAPVTPASTPESAQPSETIIAGEG